MAGPRGLQLLWAPRHDDPSPRRFRSPFGQLTTIILLSSGGSRSSSKGGDLYVSHFQWQLPAIPRNNRLKIASRKQQLLMSIATDNGFTGF